MRWPFGNSKKKDPPRVNSFSADYIAWQETRLKEVKEQCDKINNSTLVLGIINNLGVGSRFTYLGVEMIVIKIEKAEPGVSSPFVKYPSLTAEFSCNGDIRKKIFDYEGFGALYTEIMEKE